MEISPTVSTSDISPKLKKFTPEGQKLAQQMLDEIPRDDVLGILDEDGLIEYDKEKFDKILMQDYGKHLQGRSDGAGIFMYNYDSNGDGKFDVGIRCIDNEYMSKPNFIHSVYGQNDNNAEMDICFNNPTGADALNIQSTDYNAFLGTDFIYYDEFVRQGDYKHKEVKLESGETYLTAYDDGDISHNAREYTAILDKDGETIYHSLDSTPSWD